MRSVLEKLIYLCRRPPDRASSSYDMHTKGRTLAEISEKHGVSITTVKSDIDKYIKYKDHVQRLTDMYSKAVDILTVKICDLGFPDSILLSLRYVPIEPESEINRHYRHSYIADESKRLFALDATLGEFVSYTRHQYESVFYVSTNSLKQIEDTLLKLDLVLTTQNNINQSHKERVISVLEDKKYSKESDIESLRKKIQNRKNEIQLINYRIIGVKNEQE